MLRACLAMLLAAMLLPAQAQDYEREKRWSDEVVPGLVVGDAVWLEGPEGRKFLGLYTETARARAALLIVHGVGVHPDHDVIGTLRSSLADAGYATLSIQMPVLNAEATPREYQALFPNAVARIRAAASWLRSKGAVPVVLVSHSLGCSMSQAYFEATPEPLFASWVCMGLGGPFGSMRNIKVPVLDLYGENDLASVLRSDWRRRITVGSIPGSRQVMIPRADHFYAGGEKELADVIDAFLRGQALAPVPK